MKIFIVFDINLYKVVKIVRERAKFLKTSEKY